MLSERLKEFVAGWCDVDLDISDVSEILRESPDYGFSLWLKDDLRQAISNDEFTPQLVVKLTNVGVSDQAEVDQWLRGLWTTWFPGDTYPKDDL